MENKLFDSKRIAEGYLKRPWLHRYVMERIKNDCGVSTKFKNGLDVGCGAGLSTKALKLLCDRVTGTDISEAMIQICKDTYLNACYDFYAAAAEETRIPEELYDIVTAAGVINWVDKDKFLRNMRKIMADGGLLVIYDFGISDQMIGNTRYADWYNNEYLVNFPKPPRKESIWKQDDLITGFVLEKQVTYQMQYEFNMEEFVEFMLIQSNVNVQIEGGDKDTCKVRAWMNETLAPIFEGKSRAVVFNGYNWYIKKVVKRGKSNEN